MSGGSAQGQPTARGPQRECIWGVSRSPSTRDSPLGLEGAQVCKVIATASLCLTLLQRSSRTSQTLDPLPPSCIYRSYSAEKNVVRVPGLWGAGCWGREPQRQVPPLRAHTCPLLRVTHGFHRLGYRHSPLWPTASSLLCPAHLTTWSTRPRASLPSVGNVVGISVNLLFVCQ